MRHLAGSIVLLAALAAPAAAQQSQFEVHGNFADATQSHSKSWGAGAQYQMTFGAKQPVALNTSLGGDWQKQDKGGPGQVGVSYDAALLKGGGGTVSPYVGGSVGANWSTGDARQWDGARLGLETIGGVQIKVAPTISWKAEERFGYVRGQEHSLATRLGVQFTL